MHITYIQLFQTTKIQIFETNSQPGITKFQKSSNHKTSTNFIYKTIKNLVNQ